MDHYFLQGCTYDGIVFHECDGKMYFTFCNSDHTIFRIISNMSSADMVTASLQGAKFVRLEKNPYEHAVDEYGNAVANIPTDIARRVISLLDDM